MSGSDGLFKRVSSSFRDPSGFVFLRDGVLYRQVNIKYKDNYDLLMSSGLYEELVNKNLMVSHKELAHALLFPTSGGGEGECYKILQPEPISFISYPYEWSFSQLKDAGLLTLQIEKIAIEKGMSLKDGSGYNIQFRDGKPVFIDTLSFEKYKEGEPWIAYGQFCRHFLAPLVLMACKDIRLNQLLRIYIDGIPLDLVSSLLPFKTRFDFNLLSHIHAQSGSQKYFADKTIRKESYNISKLSFLGIIDSLESGINKLKWKPQGTQWGEYYEDTNYTPAGFEHKKKLVEEFIEQTSPETLWDMGANRGVFSRIASQKGICTVSMDCDPSAVEKNYLQIKKDKEKNLLPLLMDLTNPSAGMGWGNKERYSLIDRSPVDIVMALALIHHLCISNNLPFWSVARFFGKIADNLIIEFVPKEDSQVKRLLRTREDIFSSYDIASFERDFLSYFEIIRKEPVKDSERILYLMKIKS